MDSLKKRVIPTKLPMLFIDDNVLLPGVQGKITIQDKGSLQLIKEQVLMKDSFQNCIIGIFPKATHKPPFNKDEIVGIVGTAGLVLSLVGSQLPTPQYVLTVKGVRRVVVKQVITAVPYPLGEVVEANDFQVDLRADQSQKLDESIQEFKDLMNELFDLQEGRGYGVRRFKSLFHSVPDDLLPDLLVSVLKATFEEKMEILKSLDLSERFKKAASLLLKHIEALRQSKQGSEKKSGGKGKSSGPSSFLREFAKGMNINGIKLGRLMGGDDGDEEDDTVQLEAKISEANMPEYARKEALKEVKRLKKIPAHFPDHAPIRHYLEWMVDLPWDKRSDDTINIEQARHDLDADHYGLTELKKRIIEYLAVRKLKNTLKGPILCFVGPPGVGKTSVGKSIANILGRKFQRISLGGACDQSDIRGHRRTYIGSIPGRILTAVKNAGTKNPVILLDEIDKLGKGIHGDPAAALLEVLDPEQNHTFTDHYLNIPFDLSEILFIATANSTSPVSSALLDRMELLEVSGYTVEEKVIIALKYLVPKQLQEHGLKTENFMFSEEALKSIITHYTREAGVRSLERKIGAVCRVLAVEAASNPMESETSKAIMVEPSRLERILGPEIYVSEIVQRLSIPGVAIGLAWTAMGGEIMFVEASKMGGDGTLSLTGQLGEVMKESAQLALSWIRSRSVELGFTDEAYRDLMENTDVHVHFPAGAVGKDGPSAGVAITTALVSLFSGRCLRSDSAMTGEITLRGLILPVGGIKEKVLAAHRASVYRVILPSRNKKDLQKIPGDIRGEMEIIFVDRIEDALQEIFEGGYNMMLSQDLISKL